MYKVCFNGAFQRQSKTYFSLRLFAAALTCATLCGVALNADTASRPINATDSKGGNPQCLARNPIGGWMLKKCDGSKDQKFFVLSDSSAQIIKVESTGECVNANQIAVGKIVGRKACDVNSTKWKFTGKTLTVDQSTPGACLTANDAQGTSMRLGVCTQPATLTAWSIN